MELVQLGAPRGRLSEQVQVESLKLVLAVPGCLTGSRQAVEQLTGSQGALVNIRELAKRRLAVGEELQREAQVVQEN